jgi:hypothetical protein
LAVFAKASAIQTLLTEQQGQCLIQGQIDLAETCRETIECKPRLAGRRNDILLMLPLLAAALDFGAPHPAPFRADT